MAILATLVAISVGSSAPAAPTQEAPPNTTPGVCDEYAGDPDPGTAEWRDRDANNVGCSYQRREDAQSNPAFLAKYNEQVAIEEIEFATVTEWAAEPNRQHANCCTSPQSKVGDPFRSPEEWAAAGRGRHLKFSIINSNGAKLRARDNFSDVANADQADSDGDDVGDRCDPETAVSIDVRPGQDNTINTRAKGEVAVAILGTPGYDPVSRTDRASLTFGRTGDEASLVVKQGQPKCEVGDVNADQRADLVCSFESRKLGYTGSEGSTAAVLKGRTTDATPIAIRGEDAVRIKP